MSPGTWAPPVETAQPHVPATMLVLFPLLSGEHIYLPSPLSPLSLLSLLSLPLVLVLSADFWTFYFSRNTP